ncbi:MAG: sulfatase-like hydrolase/transferase [Ardenticatenaceae bacterium]|nr:sulfatase-like hydrolase/transferase [Ardenticatenaceae bacterium]MCB8991152.1 sulfatase-like hydrolase/transferase [Ardenticatenaceae bacterium]
MTRPNILFIHSDQHRYDCVGVNGHPLLQTPHLDRLATEGINFHQAYTPIPLCTPARVSLLTGQWPTEHLAISNWHSEAPRPPREGLPSFSQALRDGGYWLGHIAKWHVHPTKGALDYGFHEYVIEEGPFKGAQDYGFHKSEVDKTALSYDAWREAQGIPPRPRKRGWLGEVDPHITPEQSRLAWGADQVIRMLTEHGGEETPFFIRWDPSEPHLPNVVPEPYYSMYPPEQIPPWPSFPDTFAGKPYIQAQQLRTWGVDGWTWEDWAQVVSAYFGEISLMDAQIGRILDKLDEMGLTENTLVIYTTDHGDMCGGHGMLDKHFIMYDDVTHIPLLMRWPERIPAGTVSNAFVSHSIDLAVTFCEVADVPVPETFSGRSLLPMMTGVGGNGRSDILSMYHGNLFGMYSQRMVRDLNWKYVWNATAEDELYDMQNDPGELHNLATDPAHRDELARLRRRLLAWMEETHDLLLNPWTRKQLLENVKV